LGGCAAEWKREPLLDAGVQDAPSGLGGEVFGRDVWSDAVDLG
jgi:hypothetical protein